ncbi:MAG: GGDEF domain-containing protein [Vicinamibacterales bacterium]
MVTGDGQFGRDISIQDDIRQLISAALFERIDAVTADTVAIFPYSGAESLDSEYCGRLGAMLVRLLAFAVHDGRLDPRGGFVAELRQLVLERSLTMEQLFTFAYLSERTVLDELALNDTIGATTEPWPVVAQLVRRASFDLLAAYAERTQLDPSDTAIIDKLTTLHTRPLFEAVLSKEVERASRFGYPISLILFDVDNLSAINETHGYGVGDKILERLGILIRKYFRQHDWVARHAEDSMAVLLTRTDAEHANELAEQVRETVEERLGFTDHRNDLPVRVTVTAAVVNILKTTGVVVDPDRLLDEAERAIERGKRLGRNRVECVSGDSSVHLAPPHST